MTVFPASATRSAPAGTATFAPAATTRPSRTTIVALSIGARVVPSMSRTLVNALVDEEGCPASVALSAATAATHIEKVRIDMRESVAKKRWGEPLGSPCYAGGGATPGDAV